MSTAATEAEEGTEVQTEVSTVCRTMRFEVVWPGWRKADLRKLWPRIWAAQDDLRGAMNKAISALFQLKIGALPWPEEEAKKGKQKGTKRKVPLRTICYRALSGEWRPFGDELYTVTAEKTERVSSHALLELAGLLYTRIQTDWVDIVQGKRALPTFRSIPIGSPYVEVDQQTGACTFSLWAGRGGRVTLRPRKLDHRMWRDLRRATKFGGCRISWHQPPGRQGKWMLSLSAHYPTAEHETREGLVAAVRLGMYTTATMAYAYRGAERKIDKHDDRIDLPASTWRAVQRVARERTQRGEWNRRERAQREGRGRQRKLRSTRALGDIVARVTDTSIRQVAAAVVRTAVRRGAEAIALPDLHRWSVASALDKTEDLPEADRVERRKWYFRWHQGALRLAIKHAAEREGLEVFDVAVGGASHTCHACAKVDPAQRIEGRWVCSCGVRTDAEANTARVLALRAVTR